MFDLKFVFPHFPSFTPEFCCTLPRSF